MANIRLRFFAAARAAAGVGETVIEPDDGSTLREALAVFTDGRRDVSEIVARCSFLVNGIVETDADRVLVDGDLVDVMPPFAGG